RLIGALDLRVVDAVDRELPRPPVRAAVDRPLDRHALSDLEPVLLRRVESDNGAGPVGEEGLLLILRKLELLRVNPQPALGAGRERRELVSDVLVISAEPVGVRGVGHALDLPDASLV